MYFGMGSGQSETMSGQEEDQVQETDGYQFTVSAISNALGMYKEEKTVSRILNEVRKVHAQDIK